MALLFSSLLILPASAYVWPSPRLEALDAARWDQEGYRAATPFVGGGLGDDCLTYVGGSGFKRSNAADWIRAAYHDMATHNSVEGTGGLDASIRFKDEHARAENVGDGFANTVAFIGLADSRFVSQADTIALLALMAVENCGGPEIPFRGGRIDASAPNSPGVPEPQQNIDEHIASFALQGFNQTEMIGLVACGHSFGGVQHVSFPEVVPDVRDQENKDGNVAFDSTFVHFDNNVASEYISGTTTNPLVVGANDTTNSDKRIFASDGNATMSGFARSPELFASTCATLFAKMLDTVPRGVELTEVIEQLPVRPTGFSLYHIGDGTLRLSGEVRLFGLEENPSRTVSLQWTDRAGASHGAPLVHTEDMVSFAQSRRRTAMWYAINTEQPIALDAETSIVSMTFRIDEGDGSPARVEGQGGLGFVMQDIVMFSAASCGVNAGPDRDFNEPTTFKYKVAVRRGSNVTQIWLESNYFDGDALAKRVLRHAAVTPTLDSGSDSDPYALWTAEFETRIFALLEPHVIVAEVDGQIVETANSDNVPRIVECAAA